MVSWLVGLVGGLLRRLFCIELRVLAWEVVGISEEGRWQQLSEKAWGG